jgi:hypothetical protein
MRSPLPSFAIGILSLTLLPTAAFPAEPPPEVELHWLDRSPPATPQGVSWGVPWPQGTVKKDTTFRLAGPKDDPMPMQTWVMAYWPDGSVKWTGHATTAAAAPKSLTLAVGKPAPPPTPLQVKQTDAHIEINTGTSTYKIPKTGANLIDSIATGDRIVARQGRLVCVREDRSEYEKKRTIREEEFTGRIDKVTLEQSGTVRAVVKIEGRHKADGGERAWLPFVVRLYFYAGADAAQMVHTFIFDGDQEKDYVRGLGVRFTVPMRQQAHNRHVRLAGESTGLFAEPVRPIAGRPNPSSDLYTKQIAGKQLPNLEDLPGKANVEQLAVWDGFKLVQTSADSFAIHKRTGPQSSWVHAASGKRSLGLAFVGDTTGGLAVGMKDFWQLCPTELEVQKASADAAELTVWLWSPDSPAMDLRHYDTKAHGLEASYEDIEPGWSTATGAARTTELTLRPFADTPANEELLKVAKASAETPRLVCSPEYYHSLPIFGFWSLPDRSTPAKKSIEDQLDRTFAFYQGQIEQRHWYGFWDYGDVMHSYDATRHAWRYDVGGFAWNNTELMPDMWLWYSFLRTGRADVFRTAEAMTRNTQEVDVYHIGKFKGLGSRHNVSHWGCGAKENRISQAIQKRFYYYLTTDERTGDLMREVVDVDQTIAEIDPLRKLLPKSKYPTHMRSGPDWLACAGNWMTEWERTGDTKYRDKIVTGMKSLAGMPRGLQTSLSFGYDPKTNMLYDLPDNRMKVDHFVMIFGGAEVAFELKTLLDVPEWDKAWLECCEGMSRDGMAGPRATAFAAYVKKDAAAARRALEQVGGGNRFAQLLRVDGPGVPAPVDEIRFAGTGGTAQWCLNAIEVLELAGRVLPKEEAK